MKESFSPRIILVSVFALVLFLQSNTKEADLNRITVRNEMELIQALGNNRVITVTEDCCINLSKVLESEVLKVRAGIGLKKMYNEIKPGEMYDNKSTRYTESLECTRTIIRDCTYSIMSLMGGNNLKFIDCDFHNNQQFGLINTIQYPSNVQFSRCNIRENEEEWFHLDSPIVLNKCSIFRMVFSQFIFCQENRMSMLT